MKTKKFDVAMFRRYLLLSAVLLSAILTLGKCHAFGTGFHPPDMIEPMSPETHRKVNEDRERINRDRIRDRERSGKPVSQRDRDFSDNYDAKKIREAAKKRKK